MVVSNTTRKTDQEAGNGSVTDFDFSFKVFQESDIEAYIIDSDGVATLKTLNTHYTVSINTTTEGGTVTWLAGSIPATGEFSFIRRSLAFTQPVVIPTEANFNEKNFQNALDKAYMLMIQMDEEVGRTPKFASESSTSGITFPEPVASKIIGWNSGGTDLTNYAPADISVFDEAIIIAGGDAGKPVVANSSEDGYELSDNMVFGDSDIQCEVILKQKKGASVASASTMALGDDGNVFSITGTTNINTITIKDAGTRLTLIFADALTLSASAGNLKLPSSVDITTHANLVLEFVSDGTDWHCTTSVEIKRFVKPWSGTIATIPTGYALCDGNNGTPDLTDRFIIHADADSGGTNDVGDTGGASSITLTESEIPSHTHSDAMYNANGWSSGTNVQASNATSPAGSLTTDGGTGGGGAHSNRDKFYALAYVMKL